MSEHPDPSNLRKFEERLAAAKKAQEPEPPRAHMHSNAGAAWRMVIELVTGMLVGFGIGYGLDSLFGTLPIFLVIFCLLGFAAGVRVMIQTAQEAQRDHNAATREMKDES